MRHTQCLVQAVEKAGITHYTLSVMTHIWNLFADRGYYEIGKNRGKLMLAKDENRLNYSVLDHWVNQVPIRKLVYSK